MPGPPDLKILRNNGLRAAFETAYQCDAMNGLSPDQRSQLHDLAITYTRRARAIIKDPDCPAHEPLSLATWATAATLAGQLSREQLEALSDLDVKTTAKVNEILGF